MSSNGMDVSIKVTTLIQDGEEKEEQKMAAVGTLFQRGKQTVLRFEEPQGDQEQFTTQTIKLASGEMTVLRKGAVSMNQRFIPGKETEGIYHSAYGPMSMRTNTLGLDYYWNQETMKGIIELRYKLVMQGVETGNYNMHVSIEGGKHTQ